MPEFDRTAHIAELQKIIEELEKLPESNTKRTLLYERGRELRFWKAHEHFFTKRDPRLRLRSKGP